MKRKALIIIWFSTLDREPSRVEKVMGQINPTESYDFLVARDRHHKRAGFLEIGLRPSESVRSAIRRYNPWSDQAIIRPWHELCTFLHRGKEVTVGHVGVGKEQRAADLYEQAGEQSQRLPILTWENPGWLLRQAEEGLLNEVTGHALSLRPIQDFVRSATGRAIAA